MKTRTRYGVVLLVMGVIGWWSWSERREVEEEREGLRLDEVWRETKKERGEYTR